MREGPTFRPREKRTRSCQITIKKETINLKVRKSVPTAIKRSRPIKQKPLDEDDLQILPPKELTVKDTGPTVYVTTRILRQIGGTYLVAWYNYNPSQCTREPLEGLEKAPLVRQQFEEYENGMAAITKRLQIENRYHDQYSRQFVNVLDKRISDDDWNRWVVQYPARNVKKLDEHKIGYWRIKAVEFEWLKVLDPGANHDCHPLYLESFDPNASPPKFNFIQDYIQSNLVKRCFNSALIEQHRCVFGPQDAFCPECQLRNEVVRVGQAHVRLQGVCSRLYMVVCGPRACGCTGPCMNFLPIGIRGAPMVVFYEKRYEGYGIRAITKIPKGTIMSEYLGRIFLNGEEHTKNESYVLQTENGFMIDSLHSGNEARFFGSSCAPNMIWVPVYVRGTDMQDQYRTVFVTLREIEPGEELTVDYHTGMTKKDRPRVSAKCKCGSENCRGWV